MSRLTDTLFVASQYITPHHGLSRAVGALASSQQSWLKNAAIKRFIRAFDVNMDEAERQHPSDFSCFNDFFTRELKAGARPIAQGENTLVSPADGVISQMGRINGEAIFQAKGHDFTVTDLLGGDARRAEPFANGEFATIYLSPKDYHRVHMPTQGKLREVVYVPGKLFSVNPTTASAVPRLFARNERLVAIFDTPTGPMAMVLVGAMIVAAIETVWSGLVTPPKRELRVTPYPAPDVQLAKGAEMGRFLLGSTVILCFGENSVNWQADLEAGSAIRMGQALAEASAP